MTIRRLIRADGTTEELPGRVSLAKICKLIGAATCDTVMLKHLGRPLCVMVVDDTGMIDGRPINAEATKLYHANCRPGNPFSIHGDVVIVPDEDFA